MDDTNQQFQQQAGGQFAGQDNTNNTGQPMVSGGGNAQGTDDSDINKPKEPEMPEVSEDEVKNFDMRSFDSSLKPDLNTLSNDSLGKALGDKAGQFKGDGKTASQQYDDIVNAEIPAHNLDFNEMEFKTLLAGSISLLYEEKMAIIQQVPQLNQHKITELIRILNEEKRKFAQLNKKHQEELKKIEGKMENKEEKERLASEEQSSKASDEAAAAELLRKLQGGQ